MPRLFDIRGSEGKMRFFLSSPSAMECGGAVRVWPLVASAREVPITPCLSLWKIYIIPRLHGV